jgi:hypothetical protein
VDLAPLTGREEELLAQGKSQDIPGLVTAILQRCIRRLGSISPVTPEIVRGLLIADRQYLILKLRQLTLGNGLEASLVCPWSDCGQKITVGFGVEDIPIVAMANPKAIHQMELSPAAALVTEAGDRYRHITFRLPNGSDQEYLAPILAPNPAPSLAKPDTEPEAQAQLLLLQRCIQRLGPVEFPDRSLVRRLSTQARLEIEQQMEAIAPKVDLMMESTCPECGRDYSAPFDIQRFFLEELRTQQNLLYREVHYLAFHYHWSEAEIMAMPRPKRRKYIEILSAEIERSNDGV